VTLTVHRR